MQLLDFKLPDQPVCLSDLHVGINTMRLPLQLLDQQVYVASSSNDGSQPFALYSISNAASPVLLGKTSLNTQCETFLVQDGLVYVSKGAGLDIYDATHSPALTRLGTIDFEYSSNNDCFT